ncbi:RodZ domain-containing protein [Thermus sp.]|uniref:RodZ domain-containing protein n=1 Tax=Thermus sp. TaxID=275 RepID=UPI00307FCBA9
MCELGARLKEAREAKGLSLKEAAQALSLKAKVLEALETCRFEELPEPPLAKGYLRRYALLLGLDPEPLLALYPVRPAEAPPPPPSRRGLPLWPLALLLLLALLGLGGFLLLRPKPAPVVEVPEAPPPLPKRHVLRLQTDPPGARAYLDGFYLGQTPLVTPPLEGGRRVLRLELPGYKPLEETLALDRDLELRLALKPLPKEEAPPPAQEGQDLILRLEGRSWLRVTQGEKRLYEGIPEVGAELSFPLPVEVRAGNPGAVRVILAGRDLGPMGEPGRPLTRRFEAPSQ